MEPSPPHIRSIFEPLWTLLDVHKKVYGYGFFDYCYYYFLFESHLRNNWAFLGQTADVW